MLRCFETKGFFCFPFEQKISKTRRQEKLGFLHTFFLENEAQTNEKNTEQCFSINLKATCENSGTFEEKKFQANFPLSIVFHQALQLF